MKKHTEVNGTQQVPLNMKPVPNSHLSDCKVMKAYGDRWTEIIRHYRKGEQCGIDLESFDMIDGHICYDAVSVNTCEKMPVEMPHDQLCIKTRAGIDQLKYEGILFYKARNY